MTTRQKPALEKLLAIEKESEEAGMAMLIAAVVSVMKPDEAPRWLNKALENRNDYLLYIHFVPEYKHLKSKPEFIEVLSKIDKLKRV